jgi:hypothetical protein
MSGGRKGSTGVSNLAVGSRTCPRPDPAGPDFSISSNGSLGMNVVTSPIDDWEEKAVRAITATASSAAAG